MIFQHTIDKVLAGTKTQTRRIVKENEFSSTIPRSVLPFMRTAYRSGEIAYVGAGSRIVYEVGKTYAVQPARGKSAVARMRIMSIRREDVCNISYEDARAEGFSSIEEFLQIWCLIHDPAALKKANKFNGYHFYDVATSRPAERYDAWVLTFELVK